MGGGLLFRYLETNPEHVSRHSKIILLMPMIQKIPRLAFLSSFPMAEYFYFPKCIIFPNSKLFQTGNYLNDSFKQVPIRQLVHMYRSVMPTLTENIPNTINKFPNCYLFYANQEHFSTMSSAVTQRVEPSRAICVNGFHECFNSIFTDSQGFFRQLTDVLNTCAKSSDSPPIV